MPRINKGFTLIELLVVVSVIAILSGIMVPSFTTYIDRQNLAQAREKLKSDIRSIQNRAMTGVGTATDVNYWVIRFTQNARRYEYFTTTNTSGNCQTITPFPATASIEFSDYLPANIVTRVNQGTCIYFSFDDGDAVVKVQNTPPQTCPVNPASPWLCVIPIGLTSTTGNGCHGIFVNQAGMVRSINGGVTCL